MFEQLFIRAKDPKELHIIHGAGHSDIYLLGNEEFTKAWLGFSGRLFPAAAPAVTSLGNSSLKIPPK